jgi:tripartite-type tricarboxylate transporter receptor subunit TctC
MSQGELFKSMTGTSMTHVPYKGRQFAIPDLVGGNIQLMFDNMPSALPMAREGKIRAIAQTTAKRSTAAQDVPTVAETVPGFEATTWFAMFAPAGTPRAHRRSAACGGGPGIPAPRCTRQTEDAWPRADSFDAG